MSGGHAHGLYVHAPSSIHRLPAHCKVVAATGFVIAVIATPREATWAFGCYLALLLMVAARARVPIPFALRKLVVELPFLLFAAFLPFLGGGERVEVLGLPMSVEGLWGAWNVIAKATLGALTTVLLAATTPVADILEGLQRLRVPRAFVAIAHFMVRYGDVITGEMRRMNVARVSRGYNARWIWQAKAVASSLGSLFIRSYERGERVYLAMLSRGYTGALPAVDAAVATTRDWVLALALPALGAAVSAAAWILSA